MPHFGHIETQFGKLFFDAKSIVVKKSSLPVAKAMSVFAF
jgi:hypothetical protein